MRNVAFVLSQILIFAIPWEGLIRLPGLGTGTRLFGFVVAGFWLATIIVTGQMRKPGLFQIMISIFVVWNAVTVFWSGDPGSTASQVITWVQLLILCLIFWDLYITRDKVMAGLQAYILGAFVAIGSAISNYFSGSAFYTNYERFSPGDTNPDGFGFLVVLGIPLAWYLASSERDIDMSGLLKVVNYAYLPAAFLALALSGTRTAMIASIVGMAYGLATLTRLRIWVRIALFLVLSAVVLTLLPYVKTLPSFQRLGTTASELSAGDLNQRAGLWREGLAAFAETPLLGVGSSMYRSVNSLGKVAHNSFISVLVESGLIGFVLFGMILAIAFFQALDQPKWNAMFWLNILAVWAIGASSLTWEHRKTTWLFLSLIVASAALIAKPDEDVSSRSHKSLEMGGVYSRETLIATGRLVEEPYSE